MNTTQHKLNNYRNNLPFIQFIRRVLYYYPFTILGTTLLCISLALIYRGLIHRNPYEFLLSTLLLGILFIITAFNRLQIRNIQRVSGDWDIWDSSQPLIAGSEGMHRLDLRKIRAYVFYRIHACLRGEITIGSELKFYSYREFSSPGEELVSLVLKFPVCGVFHAKIHCTARDVFGLSRARFGPTLSRRLIVQPEILQNIRIPILATQNNMASVNKRKISDEERYYMREYVPGDRFRDINWKASDRLQELITRISPYSEDKTRIITVYFRNVIHEQRETAESVVHLNYLKSWVLAFIQSVRDEYANYMFHVITASRSSKIIIETEEDVDRFRMMLGDLFFVRDKPYSPLESCEGDKFIFTTPYDTALPSIMSIPPGAACAVFTTRFSVNQTRAQHSIRLVDHFHPLRFSIIPVSKITATGRKKNPWINWSSTAASVHEAPIRVTVF